MENITKKIKRILLKANLEGFTTALKWKQKRYIVAFTNNIWKANINLLAQQVIKYWSYYNLNIWWWKASNGDIFIDVSTSFNDINEALELAKKYNQQAIFDTKELKEVFVR